LVGQTRSQGGIDLLDIYISNLFLQNIKVYDKLVLEAPTTIVQLVSQNRRLDST